MLNVRTQRRMHLLRRPAAELCQLHDNAAPVMAVGAAAQHSLFLERSQHRRRARRAHAQNLTQCTRRAAAVLRAEIVQQKILALKRLLHTLRDAGPVQRSNRLQQFLGQSLQFHDAASFLLTPLISIS